MNVIDLVDSALAYWATSRYSKAEPSCIVLDYQTYQNFRLECNAKFSSIMKEIPGPARTVTQYKGIMVTFKPFTENSFSIELK